LNYFTGLYRPISNAKQVTLKIVELKNGLLGLITQVIEKFKNILRVFLCVCGGGGNAWNQIWDLVYARQVLYH
jgi:hypothetical protein